MIFVILLLLQKNLNQPYTKKCDLRRRWRPTAAESPKVAIIIKRTNSTNKNIPVSSLQGDGENFFLIRQNNRVTMTRNLYGDVFEIIKYKKNNNIHLPFKVIKKRV